ncbi:hypothetical protein ACQ4PT_029032 [Festuca glaucescens]
MRWADLPRDLLHVVYAKVSGPLHRVRFAAVCTSWRHAATRPRYAAPPALPWHISSFGGRRDRTKRLYRPEDGEDLSIRVPSVAVLRRFVGAHDGGWVAALTLKHVRLVLVNLFSSAEVPLSVNQRKFAPASSDGPWAIRKIVFSREPTSSGCVLAALDCSSQVALCRFGDDDGWIIITAQERSRFADIAFCKGKLYGLTTDEELDRFDFDITNKHDGATSVRLLSVRRAPQAYNIYPFNLNDPPYGHYLFDLGDNLVMARTWSHRYNKPLFEVFKIVYDRQGNTHQWAEVTSLGDYALFLGETCSRAVRVPADGRGQVERNCIYSANHATSTRQRNGTIKVAHVSHNGMWIIPPRV